MHESMRGAGPGGVQTRPLATIESSQGVELRWPPAWVGAPTSPGSLPGRRRKRKPTSGRIEAVEACGGCSRLVSWCGGTPEGTVPGSRHREWWGPEDSGPESVEESSGRDLRFERPKGARFAAGPERLRAGDPDLGRREDPLALNPRSRSP